MFPSLVAVADRRYCSLVYNRHLPLTTIDLHGQHSREAVEYTKERIEALLRVGKKTKLRVITGRVSSLASDFGVGNLTDDLFSYYQRDYTRSSASLF